VHRLWHDQGRLTPLARRGLCQLDARVSPSHLRRQVFFFANFSCTSS
jgi:hypothetical protein